MVKLLFDSEGDFLATVKNYNSLKTENVREVKEEKLQELVSERAESWEKLISGFYLDSSDTISFDSSYSPQQEGGQ